MEVIHTFPIGKVKANMKTTTVDTIKITTKLFLNILVLSMKTPNNAQPINPIIITNAPNNELSV